MHLGKRILKLWFIFLFPKAEKEPDNPQQVADVIDLTETDSEEEYEFEDGDDSGKEESDSSSNDDRSV